MFEPQEAEHLERKQIFHFPFKAANNKKVLKAG
jgi:hypothetical protein